MVLTGLSALGLVALALLAHWVRSRPYRKVFRISPRRDDAFGCRGEHRVFPVAAEPNGFELPPGLEPSGQTAFLVLTVAPMLLGRWVDPFIEVTRANRKQRQYFERSASGRRYLNVSALFERGPEPLPARVDLRGKSIGWKREAKLLLFPLPPVDEAEVLVLAPHPDDAEIAAFGLYARGRSWVATVTAGEGAMADLAVTPRGKESARWNALLRVSDSITIPQLAGVRQERCLNLIYPDNQLQNMHAEPSRPFRIACEASLPRAALRARNGADDFRRAPPDCTWNSLVDDLRQLLEKGKPDIVVCPHPLVDGHHDHVFTTVAVEQAARAVPQHNRLFLLYVVHRRDAPLYPFGPSSSWVAPPPWNEDLWIADSIYSHPLSPDERTAKYFAVEANHDLRTYSAGESKTLKNCARAVAREVAALLGGTALPAASFIRRAPRPNEIYCVVSAESLSRLVERALARYA